MAETNDLVIKPYPTDGTMDSHPPSLETGGHASRCSQQQRQYKRLSHRYRRSRLGKTDRQMDSLLVYTHHSPRSRSQCKQPPAPAPRSSSLKLPLSQVKLTQVKLKATKALFPSRLFNPSICLPSTFRSMPSQPRTPTAENERENEKKK